MDSQDLQWIRIREGDLRGIIVPELKSVLTARLFEDLDHQVVVHGGVVLKDSRVRWAAILPLEDGKILYVKQFRIVGEWQRIKYLFRPSQAMKEFETSQYLLKRGVLTPGPLGVLERRKYGFLKECFFLAEGLREARDILDCCRNQLSGPDQREDKNQFLRILAKTARKIHDTGLFHKDLHGGNFLVTGEDSLSLYLVDLHQARKQRRVSKSRRLWNIAQIFNSLDFMLDHGAKNLFLLTYGQGRASFGRDLDRCLKRTERMVQKMVKRRQKSRAKRCLKESTLFTIDRQADLIVFRRREVARDDLMAILRAHREVVQSSREKLLKYSPKTIVSMIDRPPANGRRVCVKEYRYKRLWYRVKNSLRRPKGKASWVAGNALFNRGFCHVKPLAYVERRKLTLLQQAFYITESIADDLEMDRYLAQRFEGPSMGDMRGFVKQFAEWMGSLHRAGIYHRDLKTCNILVREIGDGWGFSLVDLEDVAQATRVGTEKILRNLVQINCSIPKSFSYGDRVRFMKEYLRAHPTAIDERVFIERVLEESRRRGIVYVSSEGEVIEKFE